MKIQDCNPFVRAAEIQPAVLEGTGARMAYDHRLFYILDGEGFLLLDGKTLPLSPDALLYWPFRVGYHFRGKLRTAVLNFDLSRDAAHRTVAICPPPAAEFDPALLFNTALLEENTAPLIRPDSAHLREDVLAIVNAFAERDPLADAVTSALLKKLLAELFAPSRRDNAADELAERVRRHIRLYAPEIQNNEDIGRAFGYHPVYIAALFRARTGETLHHAILRERVRLAERFLTRTNNTIEEIAYDTGFSSRSHFCTVFKSFMGISPQKYRAR